MRSKSLLLAAAVLAAAHFAGAAACAPTHAPPAPPPRVVPVAIAPSHAAAPLSPIRVLVYNIHAGRDADGTDNLERVARRITEADADLVLLQEVDRGTERSGRVDQLAVLARLTGFEGAFGRTLDYQGGQYGIAVLSRWPILSDTLIPLRVEPAQARAGGSYEPRGALRVTVDAPGGVVGVINTHLDASRDDGYRRQEVGSVRRIAKALREAHPRTVVGGDFNAEPGSATIGRMLDDGWIDAWSSCGTAVASAGGPAPGLTYPAHDPVKRIDYLFLAPGLPCAAAVVPETTTSDHRPLVVTLTGVHSTPDPRQPMTPEAAAWVDRTLAALTLREKAAQLVMPWVGADYVATDSPEMDRLLEWVATHGVGGLVLSIGLPHSYAAKLNALQRRATVPLLIASDMENGPGMRMSGIYSLPHLLPQGGGTAFPPVMALGAARSDALAYALGRITALEARAVGVHLGFGPVMDVNSNPANPIINTRSMGEDPALVGRLGAAYIRGAHDAGLLTTAKHFPGHGDTSEDSHIALPTITADRARMDTVELPPFRAAVDAGVDAIMTAHISVPGVEGPGAAPATLSPYFMTDVLRGEMGFQGLLFTDAMTMGGVAGEFGGGDEVLVRALEAGADVLLMPPDVGGAVEAVAGAVRGGRLSEARLDRSVRRVLEAKARAGLHRTRLVDLDAVDDLVGTRAHTAVARELAERALTLPRDRAGLLPLDSASRVLVLTYAGSSNPAALRTFPRVLGRSLAVDAARVDERTTPAGLDSLRVRADSADIVVAAAQVTPREYEGTVDPAAAFAAFVDSLAAGGKPVVAVSFGSPYLLDGFPSVGTYLLAWGGADVSQAAAADALLGRVPITGRLPIALPPHHPLGAGIQRQATSPAGATPVPATGPPLPDA